MVITTTFATWFGPETVMGIPAKFVQGRLGAWSKTRLVPACAWCWWVLSLPPAVPKNLLTIGDFYRQRYGKGVEIFCSLAIILSYLGWVAAQSRPWAWCSPS